MIGQCLRFSIVLAAWGFFMAGCVSIAACVSVASGWVDAEVITGAAWSSVSLLGAVVVIDALLLLMAFIDSRSGGRS